MWIRDLPVLMAPSQPKTHTHVPSTVFVSTTHSLASAPASHHPSVRPSLTRNTFVDFAFDYDRHHGFVLPALDTVPEEGENVEHQRPQVGNHQSDVARSPSHSAQSNSKWRRYSIGARRSADLNETSELPATASQRLARKLSRQTRPTRTRTLPSGSHAPRSYALDIGPVFQSPYGSVSIERSESLDSASQALREDSSPTRSTATKRTNRWNLAFGKGKDGNVTVATRNTQSDLHISNLNSGSARLTNVPDPIAELGPPPQPKQRRKLSNYQRTNKDKFSVSRPVRDITNSDDDSDVRNDSGDDNCEDEFFDVDSGSYNGPRSTKTMSKQSFSTGSFTARSVLSVDSGDVAWVYK